MNGAIYILMGWLTAIKALKPGMTWQEWQQTKNEQADHLKERADFTENLTEKEEYLVARSIVLETT